MESRTLLAADMLGIGPPSGAGAVELVPGALEGELFLPGCISGSVFATSDESAIRQQSDPGIAGVRLELLDGQDRVLAEALTDDAGRYEFPALTPGVYSLREQQPAGHLDGQAWVGSGGGSATGDLVSSIVLTPGAELTGYDFAERPQTVAVASASTASTLEGATGWLATWTGPPATTRPAPPLPPRASLENFQFVAALPPVVQRPAEPIFGGGSRALHDGDAARERAISDFGGALLAKQQRSDHADDREAQPTRGEQLVEAHEARDRAFELQGAAGEPDEPAMAATHAKGARPSSMTRRAAAGNRVAGKPAA